MDLYEILKIPREASEEEIKLWYRNRVKTEHPDGGGSEERFNRVQSAFEILSDPVRRKRYDTTGEFEESIADNSHVELMSIVSVALDVIMSKATSMGVNPESINFVSSMIEFLRFSCDEVRQQIVQLEKTQRKWERLKSRFSKRGGGSSVLDDMVSSKVSSIQVTLEQLSGSLALNQKAQDFINQYDFAEAGRTLP